MQHSAQRVPFEEIAGLREQFLQLNRCQIRFDACHHRGWSDSYLLRQDHQVVGYGSVKGREELSDRDSIFEFFVLPEHRSAARSLFVALLATSRAKFIECQTNEPLLSSLTYQFADQIRAEAILFADSHVTELAVTDVIFRKLTEADNVFEHRVEPQGPYVLAANDEIVATGGFATHYNEPFADLYMEVREDRRRQGLGSYLLQELKRECRAIGHVPAARCNIENKASRATLEKAGLRVCGFVVCGIIVNPIPVA